MKRIIILLTIGILLELAVTRWLSAAEGKSVEKNSDQWSIVGLLFPSPTPTPSPTPIPTPTPTPTPAFGQPIQMEIPSINVATNVEQTSIDAEGRMGVPTNPFNVGWFSLGTRIGWQGNAIITGHYDTVSGAQAIFYYLNRIPVGAEIILSDEIGRKMVYQVYASESRPTGEWSLDEIFGETDERHLNLITCSGWWNFKAHNYSHRHIVFSRLVE